MIEAQSSVDILALSRIKLTNENGDQIYFNQLWKSGSIVIIFLRHFGCIACRGHLDKIWSQRESLKKRNINIVFIGNGSVEAMKQFKKELGYENVPIFTDPSLESFDACGMNNGIQYLFSLKTIKNGYKLFKEGYTQGNIKDSGYHKQMGGVVAFRSPGKLIYRFVAESLGDFDNTEDWPAS